MDIKTIEDPTQIRDEKAAKEYMMALNTQFDFLTFVHEHMPAKANVELEDISHIQGGLRSMCMKLAGAHMAGAFITAMANGNVAEALRRADETNKVAISIYQAFLDTEVPPILINK